MRAHLGIALALAALAACAPTSTTLTEPHAAAIRDSVTTFLDTFAGLSARAQWDSLRALYASDDTFRFLESGEIRYGSASAIGEAMASVPAGTKIHTQFRDLTIQPLAPGLATASGLFATRFVDSTGGGFNFGGAITLVLRHDPAGWRIVTGHSSAPVPRGP